MGNRRSGIHISIYNVPKRGEEGMASCARVITSGTKHLDDICEYISDCSTVNSADIKGVLDALSNYIGTQLSYGYSVELEGLGHFSPSVKSKRVTREDGTEKNTARIDSVNFRCSPKLKEKVNKFTPILVKRAKEPEKDMKIRKTKMLSYLDSHSYINATIYATLNRCSRYRATNDIGQFEREGIIRSVGRSTHRVYVLPGHE